MLAGDLNLEDGFEELVSTACRMKSAISAVEPIGVGKVRRRRYASSNPKRGHRTLELERLNEILSLDVSPRVFFLAISFAPVVRSDHYQGFRRGFPQQALKDPIEPLIDFRDSTTVAFDLGLGHARKPSGSMRLSLMPQAKYSLCS